MIFIYIIYIYIYIIFFVQDFDELFCHRSIRKKVTSQPNHQPRLAQALTTIHPKVKLQGKPTDFQVKMNIPSLKLTASEFTPENGWLEYEAFPIGFFYAYFQGRLLLVSGRVTNWKSSPQNQNQKNMGVSRQHLLAGYWRFCCLLFIGV